MVSRKSSTSSYLMSGTWVGDSHYTKCPYCTGYVKDAEYDVHLRDCQQARHALTPRERQVRAHSSKVQLGA